MKKKQSPPPPPTPPGWPPEFDFQDALRYWHIVQTLAQLAKQLKNEPVGTAVPVPTIKVEVGPMELQLSEAKLTVTHRRP